MAYVILWTVVFSISNALSIVFLGDRTLISGNLFAVKSVLNLVFHWKFVASMTMALVSRASFILINNALLKVPRLASGSTTIAAFITLVSIVVVVAVNWVFLKERMEITQILGAVLIMAGVWTILS